MSSQEIPLDFAAIISTVLEGVLYGISLVMFGGTLWALGYGRLKSEINRSMALIAALLTILSTIHLAIDIKRLQDGFITYRDTIPGGPEAFFADVKQETFVFKNAVYSIQTLLGDAVVIYRCYVVWQSRSIIILAVLLWFAVAATSVGFLYNIAHATVYAEIIFVLNTGTWITSFYALTIATNVLSSTLLAYRIWTVSRGIPTPVRVTQRRTKTRLILRVLVEAAILYTLTLFAVLMCFAYENNGQFIVLDMITPIISITFYMVFIRIGIAKNSPASATPAALSPLNFVDVQTMQSQQRLHPMQSAQSIQYLSMDGDGGGGGELVM
ncbi:hypothetical protein HYDPIDRAFT_114550 [Hydnomerulius pinastri MD-312]|uniref:Uncharacterized protein n=1 Tax=Hydnomerulius pinastri MD-312 TaxID=994086 RepID=A0A0C9VW90_9AGAM|nr:hypothetical protein HYDPIDRAFT_114550 [Hydnomerulius pinastri MD-312]